MMLIQRAYGIEHASQGLADFFQQLAAELDDLVNQLRDAQDASENAGTVGLTVIEDLTKAEREAALQLAGAPMRLFRMFSRTVQASTYCSRLSLEVAQRSIADVSGAAISLEAARRSILTYRHHVAQFAAQIAHSHRANSNLAPHHEVQLLRGVIARFGEAVFEARHGSDRRRD